jgi:hypothetical protein
MFNFLKESTDVSSMRVTLFIGTLCICLLTIGVFVYLIIHATKCTTLDWSGMSIFLTSLAAFTGTLLYGKVQQKKVEKSNLDNQNIEQNGQNV